MKHWVSLLSTTAVSTWTPSTSGWWIKAKRCSNVTVCSASALFTLSATNLLLTGNQVKKQTNIQTTTKNPRKATQNEASFLNQHSCWLPCLPAWGWFQESPSPSNPANESLTKEERPGKKMTSKPGMNWRKGCWVYERQAVLHILLILLYWYVNNLWFWGCELFGRSFGVFSPGRRTEFPAVSIQAPPCSVVEVGRQWHFAFRCWET